MRNFIFTLFALLCTIAAVFSQELDEDVLKIWWQKDLELDSIPGIGLERTYNELIKDKRGEEVIVAVLDTKLDIDHEDLKNQIWVNNDEIPNNGIDDDENGYIDDVNGWNFLGNSKGGEVPYQSLEIVRIIKRYEQMYPSNYDKDIPSKFRNEYERAKKILIEERASLLGDNSYFDSIEKVYFKWKKDVLKYLKGNAYTKASLDSLAIVGEADKEAILWMKEMIDWGIEQEGGFKSYIDQNNTLLQKNYSLDFEERKNVENGNANVKGNDMPFQHSTAVSGIISATRNNGLGVEGFNNSIRIMPVIMVSYGDEHDEDVAKAIRYAVDNGAHIINMSWMKYFSTQTELVKSALLYAAEKDVFIAAGSGNDSKNIDVENKFPTDYYNDKEILKSFVQVGGTTHLLGSNLVASFSNFGFQQVDLMAPANQIYLTDFENSYKTSNGTSYSSPMVAGTAALLKSYFPKLTAIQLKEIILNSGTKLDIMVKRPGDDDDAPLVPFSSLSKTGSILNTYAAFKYAMELKN